MKIVNNDVKEEKNGKKLPLVPIAAGFAIVALIVACSFFMGRGGEQENDDQSLVALNEEPSPTPTVTPSPTPTPTPTVAPEPPSSSENVDENVMQVVAYTTIECDEASLKKLVIDTMNGMNERLSTYRGEVDIFNEFMEELESKDFVKNATLDGKIGQLSEEMNEEVGELEWLNACGCIGETIFYALSDDSLHPNNYHEGPMLLSHAVAYSFYGFGLTEDDLEIKADNVTQFETSDGNFDVNFDLYFDHDGESYVVLIGNVDGNYKVLDVVNADDFDGEEMAETQSGDEKVSNEKTGSSGTSEGTGTSGNSGNAVDSQPSGNGDGDNGDNNGGQSDSSVPNVPNDENTQSSSTGTYDENAGDLGIPNRVIWVDDPNAVPEWNRSVDSQPLGAAPSEESTRGDSHPLQ